MIGRNTETVEERLLRYYQKTDSCWNWIGGKDRDGYGMMRHMWVMGRAHHWAYRTWVGEIPTGMWVLHKCDNPSCIRPDHLFLGTAADNSKDRDKKNRGGHNPNAGNNGRRAKRDHQGRFACV